MTMRPPPFFVPFDRDLLREAGLEQLDQPRVAFGILSSSGCAGCAGVSLSVRTSSFGLPDREPLLDAALQYAQLLFGRGAGDGLGVAHRDKPLLEGQLHLVRELEQAQVVRHRRPFFAHLLREGVLRQVALVDERCMPRAISMALRSWRWMF